MSGEGSGGGFCTFRFVKPCIYLCKCIEGTGMLTLHFDLGTHVGSPS
jgi:hypothetical protein